MRSPKIRRNLIRVTQLAAKFLVIAGCIGLIWWLYQYGFTIISISCNNSGGECPEPVLAEINRLKGQPLNLVDTQQLRDKILGGSPQFEDAVFTKELPGKISLQLEEADTIAQLVGSSSSGVLVISNTFQVTNQQTELQPRLNLIEMEGSLDVTVGDTIHSPRLRQSILLSELLNTNYILFDNIKVASDSVQVKLKNGPVVLIDESGDLARQIKTMQLIVASETDKTLKQVDVRYEKPVVVWGE